MKVSIGNISANIRKDSINIDDTISGRSTASFTVLNNPNHFNQGLPVQINDYSNEMLIKNGYYPPYSNKAKVTYIKGRTYETVNLFDLESHYVGITVHSWATIDSYNYLLNSITINNLSSDGNTNDYIRIHDVSVVNGQQYTITYKADGTENWNRILIYDGLADVLIIDSGSHVNGIYSVTFVATSDVIDLIIYANSNVGKIQTVTYSEIMLNEGSSSLPYEPHFKGLKSVGGTIEGQTLPTLRGLETVYDECQDNKITRKFVEANLWEYTNIYSTVTEKTNVYMFVLLDFTITYGLNKGIDYIVNTFPYIDYGTEDIRGSAFASSNNNFVLHVEKSIIDDIIARTDLLYEWKLQEDVVIGVNYEWKLQEEVETVTTDQYTINPLLGETCAVGYTYAETPDPDIATCTKQTTVTTWKDVSPEQLQWSETQPTSDSTHRWVKTGNEQNITEWQDVLPLQTKLSATQPAGDSTHQWVETGYTTYSITEVEALLIYLEEEKIQGIFELAKYTEETVPSIYINMQYGQPLVIDSIDTTIKVLLDYYLLFAGFIDIASESIIGTKGNRQLNHRVECKDNTYLLDKRIIAKAYPPNTLCGDIVKDIVVFLKDEGVTEGIIEDGANMEEVVFNYINTKKASFKLAEASGFIVFIDYDRRLHFRRRDYDINPIPLLEADVMHDHKQIRVDIGNQEYRNKQYTRGKDLTDTQVETFGGNGANRNFTLVFPCGEKPIIYDNGNKVSETDIGIRGVEENKKWYWSKDSNIINQDENEEVIPTGTNVQVEYKGLYDLVVALLDKAEIDTRAELEHNSGIIEKISEEPDNSSILTAIDSGNAKLDKYAINGKVIECYTRRRDIESGQTIRVTLPSFNIDEDMLVQGVNISQEDTVTWYQLTLVAGPEQQTFYDMIENATTPNISVIRENIDEAQAVPVDYSFTKTWLEADLVNIFYEVYPSDTLYPSTDLYPMFEPSDRVKYMEVMSNSTALIRVKPIKQITEDKEIKSIFYIKTKEANDEVTSFKFYGGSKATEEIGSGVLIDTQPITARTKTNLEIFIITKTDVKGW